MGSSNRLGTLGAVVLATIVILGGLYMRKALRAQWRALEREAAAATIASSRATLLMQGYRRATPPDMNDEPGGLLFVGHIYAQTGYDGRNRSSLTGDPLAVLKRVVRGHAVERVIFGGDNVQVPTAEALAYLDRRTASLSRRFILGNHDDYWHVDLALAAGYPWLYGTRHAAEDIDGVRLVYLHSVAQDGSYGLDSAAVAFLEGQLTGDEYRYAVVFLHHALWAGNTIYANTWYPEADSLAQHWLHHVAPRLVAGRVVAVVAGDGGVRVPGRRMEVAGLPHYVTGWSTDRPDILPEWLLIDLGEADIQVTWHAVLASEIYSRREALPAP